MEDPIFQLVQRHLNTTFPGAVIDIRFRGERVYYRAFGARQVQPVWKPVTLDTVFDLASLTKPLSTALLVLTVFETQGISLDTTLGELMSGVPAETGSRSVRSVLAHTAGFPAAPQLERTFTDPDSADRATAQRLVRGIRPTFPADQNVLYSCTGFVLLGELLEELTGRRIDHLFTERIARPLGLQHLGYRPIPRGGELPFAEHDAGHWADSGGGVATTEFCSWRRRWICGEVHDETAWCLGGVSGNAGLFGTSSDIQHLLEVLLSDCRSESTSARPLLSGKLVGEAVSLETGGLNERRGLGFELSAPDNSAGPALSERAFGHTGFTGTSFWVDPDKDLSIVALTNRVHLGRDRTAEPLQEFRRSLSALAVDLLEGR